jgi:hypothetical protein
MMTTTTMTSMKEKPGRLGRAKAPATPGDPATLMAGKLPVAASNGTGFRVFR